MNSREGRIIAAPSCTNSSSFTKYTWLPDSDLDHAAEQLRVVGDNASDVDDHLLLQNSLPLPTIRGAFAVDDALDHPWRQWVRDHLFLVSK